MDGHACRACRGGAGELVLDLGDQPACDYFPRLDDLGPDPAYPLQMWLCSSCGLAQLLADPTVPEEPRGAEPEALVAQARDAVSSVAKAGLLRGQGTVAEYGSPHGGSWLGLLADHGLTPVSGSGEADIVLDCFGMMHAADQAAAIAERAARVVDGGLLLLQYHSLGTIIKHGQWNALRHGHYAYYSATALTALLAGCGFRPRTSWQFDLYGGTVLLAASRNEDAPDETVRSLLASDERIGVCEPAALNGLQRDMLIRADLLHDWLAAQKSEGKTVLGYGAASRAVALLRRARADRELLPAVIDAAPAKQGLRMPGTDIPIVSPAHLNAHPPDVVLVLVSDLMAEACRANPGVQSAGGSWVDVDALCPQGTGT